MITIQFVSVRIVLKALLILFLLFLLQNCIDSAVDVAALEKSCGVGVVVTQDQIESCVGDIIAKYPEIKTLRCEPNSGL